jgi:broad specificity phosphatase PhoE
VVARQVHLVRHGEVFNPDRILYGRLRGFGLSKLGHRMAQAVAADLAANGRTVSALVASPLQRTRESAAPISAIFGLPIQIDDRVIEPTNHFEGTNMRRALQQPINWPYLVNPLRPSWGEPYADIAGRMRAAVDDAFDSVDDGDVVIVSHQLPIWTLHRALAGERLAHDPRKRRCTLSSITTLALREPLAPRDSREIVEVGYSEPAFPLQANATDVGAV